MSANLNKFALEVQVDLEHGSIADDPARFRTTRWSAILVAADSQIPGSRAALTELCRLYTVSDPADIEQEIHVLCDALVADEGRL